MPITCATKTAITFSPVWLHREWMCDLPWYFAYVSVLLVTQRQTASHYLKYDEKGGIYTRPQIPPRIVTGGENNCTALDGHRPKRKNARRHRHLSKLNRSQPGRAVTGRSVEEYNHTGTSPAEHEDFTTTMSTAVYRYTAILLSELFNSIIFFVTDSEGVLLDSKNYV